MNTILKVSSSNEHSNGGCDFAFVELTAEIAAIALRRIVSFRQACAVRVLRWTAVQKQ